MPRNSANPPATSRADNHRKIVILDLLSEMNRGDAAIQVGMLKMLRQAYPGATFTVVAAIGANQYPDLLQEFDHSLLNGESIHGGLIPTYYPLKKKAGNAPLFEIKNVLGIISRLWILAALKINIPALFVKRLLSRKYQLVMDRILDADLVVIKGRNYRQRKSEALEIFRVATKIFNIWLCALLNKRIFLIGVSAWEQRSELATRMLANAFKSCELVTVREKRSLKVVQKMATRYHFDTPLLMPDLSYATFEGRSEIIRSRKSFPTTDFPRLIGITLLDWKTDDLIIRDKYLESVSQCITHFSQSGTKFIIIPQVIIKWDESSGAIDRLCSEHAKNITVIKDHLYENELLRVYAALDMLVGTRMHSAVFAAAVNTPFVAIANDIGAKWNIIEDLGYKDYLINYRDITPQILIDKINDCWRNKRDLVEYAWQVVERNAADLQAFGDKLNSII